MSILAGCASAPPPRPVGPSFEASDLPFVVPPARGWDGAVSPVEAARLDELHRRLVAEGAIVAVRAGASELVAGRPGLLPAQVLAAQADLLEGRLAAVMERLEPVVEAAPSYEAAQLLVGRAAEGLADVPRAFVAYRALAGANAAASERAAALAPRAVEIVGNRFSAALDAGRTDAAARHLESLSEWAPEATGTLFAAQRLAAARSDPDAELRVVRLLRERLPADGELYERHADLEIEAGDPGAGIRMLQDLAATRPGDERLARRLARARFRWRLVLLPSEVQELTRRPELGRGEFAALLYWLFPGVRYARPESPRIANDVFDDPHREEIVKVVNLGLMEVDSSLHRFEPDRPVARVESLAALLKLAGRGAAPPACLGPVTAGRRVSWPMVCRAAVDCGLIGGEADCLPTAPLSGAEAVEYCRLTQDLIGQE